MLPARLLRNAAITAQTADLIGGEALPGPGHCVAVSDVLRQVGYYRAGADSLPAVQLHLGLMSSDIVEPNEMLVFGKI